MTEHPGLMSHVTQSLPDAAKSATMDRAVQLSWHKHDIEQKCLFSGARFTRVSTSFTVLAALLLSAGFYAVVLMLPWPSLRGKFTEQGLIPCFIVFFSMWSLAILFVKQSKLRMQRRCLSLELVPPDPEFVLSPRSVDVVFDAMYRQADEPRQFMLLNRISIALSNLRNIGRVSDVDEILRSQSDSDEAISESSYVLVGGFVWAIPILGFIGTVLGLSIAIGEFGNVMQASSGADALLPALQKVTGGLGTAFDTTLIALVFALAIQLLVTFLRKAEQEFLDSCSEYCTRNIVNRLRLLPFQTDSEESNHG